MIPTIAVHHFKGGVGKTTTALDIGYALGEMGKKVIFIDLCPQANLTYSATGVISEQPEGTLYQSIIEKRPLHEILAKTKHPNVLIAPGSIFLSTADIALATKAGREWILRYAIEKLIEFLSARKVVVDYFVIDTPPALGLLTVNALVACGATADAGGFVIPVLADVYATLGIAHLRNTVAELRENLRIPIRLLGAVATSVDQTKDTRDFVADIQTEFGSDMFQTTIPRNVRVKEANNKQVLYHYAPNSAGALAYMELTKEIVQRAG
jgi:chromosome partitioning protein